MVAMVLHSLEDFETDHNAEIYGPEKKKSHCRATNSTSSLRQVKMTQATKAIANQRGIEDLLMWKMELQKQVTDAMDRFKSLTSAFMNMHENMLQSMQQNMNMQQNQFGDNVTPRSEVASNIKRTRVGSKNLNSNSDTLVSPVVSTNKDRSSSKRRKYVILLSRDLKDVAKGYIARYTTCHQRTALLNIEKVVWVTEVIDPEALIFDGPQNGKYKLRDIADGGYVIWAKYRLRIL